ncbi:hypothetical protein [Salinibius halmophilus]|uniref:hypothetical protein n=1 Tax=Salinibius halmophilus TaxID=1853216 RepID=UPI0013145126|nr:hypothetical protein [Salinibius halmophilus]
MLIAFVVGWFAPWPIRLLFWLLALTWWGWQAVFKPLPLRISKDQTYVFRQQAWQPVDLRRSRWGVLYISLKVGKRPYWWRYWRDSLSEEQWRRLSIWVKHGVLEP